jgi:hypothetical protein
MGAARRAVHYLKKGRGAPDPSSPGEAVLVSGCVVRRLHAGRRQARVPEAPDGPDEVAFERPESLAFGLPVGHATREVRLRFR